MPNYRTTALASIAAFVLLFAGCNPSGTPSAGSAGSSANNQAGHDHGEHDHGDHAVHGPRDGELIELGEEAYHAEWLLDEVAGTVTVYILDSTATKDVPITAEALTVEVTLDGDVQTESLAAVRDAGASQSARFQSDSKSLVSLLKLVGKGTEATLTVDIDGTTYPGKFVAHEHAHGHEH